MSLTELQAVALVAVLDHYQRYGWPSDYRALHAATGRSQYGMQRTMASLVKRDLVRKLTFGGRVEFAPTERARRLLGEPVDGGPVPS